MVQYAENSPLPRVQGDRGRKWPGGTRADRERLPGRVGRDVVRREPGHWDPAKDHAWFLRDQVSEVAELVLDGLFAG